ncbi:MAG: hypothetical protein ACSHYB_01590 [Roseibacillus sp.]
MKTLEPKEQVDLQRLHDKLDEFKNQLYMDRVTVAQEMRLQLNEMKSMVDEPSSRKRHDAEEESVALYQQVVSDLQTLELKLDLVALEVGEVFTEKRELALQHLDQLQSSLREASVQIPDSSGSILYQLRICAEKLEDKLEGMHLHLLLNSCEGSLAEEKREELSHAIDQVKSSLSDFPKGLAVKGRGLRSRLKILSEDVNNALERFLGH